MSTPFQDARGQDPHSGPPGLPGLRAQDPKAPPPPPPAPPSGPAGPDFQEDTGVDVDTKPTTPKRYKVLYHNDDYTTMEFVVETLLRFFHKTQAEATHIMLTVHTKGKAVAGVYTRDVAETKVENVMSHARESGMPLLVTSEPE